MAYAIIMLKDIRNQKKNPFEHFKQLSSGSILYRFGLGSSSTICEPPLLYSLFPFLGDETPPLFSKLLSFINLGNDYIVLISFGSF